MKINVGEILTWRKGSFKTLLLLTLLQIHRWPQEEIDKDINPQFQRVCMLLRKAIWYSEDRLLLVSRWIIFDYNISPSVLSQYDWYKGTDCKRLEDENGGLSSQTNTETWVFFWVKQKSLEGFMQALPCIIIESLKTSSASWAFVVPLTGLRQGLNIVQIQYIFDKL